MHSSRRAAFVSLAALVYFAGAMILLHLLRPDLDPARHFISEYAIGPYAPLMATRGTIHIVDAQVNFISALIASLALALSFRRDPRWRGFFWPALLLSAGILASFILFFVQAGQRGASFGIGNRVMALSMVAWLLATSLHLRALAGTRARHPAPAGSLSSGHQSS